MAEPLEVEAGERSTEELLAALDDGRRVQVRVELLGGEHTVTLRLDDGTYYCDTPTTLYKHDDVEAMRRCIREQGYGE